MFQEWFKDYEKLKKNNNMNEKEIIKICRILCGKKNKKGKREYPLFANLQLQENYSKDEIAEAIESLLDLYNKEKLNSLNLSEQLNKEKEKNKELQEYANWHIEHLTEDIADYIDDDRKGNASIIGEFKEEREHWKDIIRIINNEKTYIDYKNY